MEKIDCDFSPAAITRIPGALVLVLRQEQPLRGGAAFHSACGLFFAALHWFAMLAFGPQMAFRYTPVKRGGQPLHSCRISRTAFCSTCPARRHHSRGLLPGIDIQCPRFDSRAPSPKSDTLRLRSQPWSGETALENHLGSGGSAAV